jgi:hypothetical protein
MIRPSYSYISLLNFLCNNDGVGIHRSRRAELQFQTLKYEFRKEDKAIAIIALRDIRPVKQTLSQVTGYDSYFTTFGWPLSSAVRLGDPVLLQAIMDVLESKKSNREKRKLVWKPSALVPCMRLRRPSR